MRVELKTLLEKLGVKRVLLAYETVPWFYEDEDIGISCSAEIRMGPASDYLEAEIQFMKDEDKTDDDETGDQTGKQQENSLITQPVEQMFYMRAQPSIGNQWSPVSLKIKKEDYTNTIYDWEGKGCQFFQSAIQHINMQKLPEIDELVKRQMVDESKGKGGRGRIGRKSPKIKPASLLGMKKP